jgi:hypothetical protein
MKEIGLVSQLLIQDQVIKVNSFQLADSKCFEGSTWKFIKQ